MKKFKYFIGDIPIFENDKESDNYDKDIEFSYWYYLMLIPLLIPLIYTAYEYLYSK